jgi:hypothetical protein
MADLRLRQWKQEHSGSSTNKFERKSGDIEIKMYFLKIFDRQWSNNKVQKRGSLSLGFGETEAYQTR